ISPAPTVWRSATTKPTSSKRAKERATLRPATNPRQWKRLPRRSQIQIFHAIKYSMKSLFGNARPCRLALGILATALLAASGLQADTDGLALALRATLASHSAIHGKRAEALAGEFAQREARSLRLPSLSAQASQY